MNNLLRFPCKELKLQLQTILSSFIHFELGFEYKMNLELGTYLPTV